MATINVMLNFLGTPVSKDYLTRLRDGKDHTGDIEYRMMRQVLELPLEHLPQEVLERYVEVSSKESYIAIFPHTDKLFDRFLFPFKSAKRLYCLGEYLATIEVSAHLGEMLALLLWQITPITMDGKRIEADMEKAIWGTEFEKMGQEKRINLLKVFGAVSEQDAQNLDFLRATRRKYFHFWSASISGIKEDALNCFLKVAMLVKNVLQISYVEGALAINPLLHAYLEAHKRAEEK